MVANTYKIVCVESGKAGPVVKNGEFTATVMIGERILMALPVPGY
jgi:hypothetical protein